MKNIPIYLFVFFVLVAVSCKKNQAFKPEPNGDKALHKVGFTVTGFTQSYQTLSNGLHVNAGSIPQPVTALLQLIYSQSGSLVQARRQLNTDADFGSFADSLASGNYTVVFVELENLLALPPSSIYPLYNIDTLKNCMLARDPNSSGQLYEKKLSLTVNTTDLNTAVVLDRKVGQLQIVLTDPIPANVSTITVQADSIQSQFSVANQAAVPGPGDPVSGLDRLVTIAPSQIGVTNFTIAAGLYFIQTSPIPVTITAQDASMHTLASVRTHVTLAYNQITVLKGSLFGNNGTGGSGANITVDPGWNPTPISVSF